MQMWRNWQLRERALPVGEEASLRRRRNKENCEGRRARRLCYKPYRGARLPENKLNMQMWRNWQLRERALPVGEEASLRRRRNKENCEGRRARRLCYKPYRGARLPENKLNMQMWRNWQTRWIQVPVKAISYGFKSLHLHQKHSRGFNPLLCFLYK